MRRTSCQRMQRLRCCASTASSAGRRRGRRRSHSGQRGAKAQPVGMAARLGTMPGMAAELLAGRFMPGRRRRAAASSAGGRRCRGGAGCGTPRATGPSSTIAAGIHHRDAVGDLGDDAEIVGDEEHAHAALALELAQQVEDLRLDGDVERGRRLVGDEQRRVAGERHGDRGALAHAAGELVRILAGAASRVGDADLSSRRDRRVQRLALAAGRGGRGSARRSGRRWCRPG